MKSPRTVALLALLISLVLLAMLTRALLWPREGEPGAEQLAEGVVPPAATPSFGEVVIPADKPSIVTVEKLSENKFRYLVNGKPQVFVGMGYNPIYRYLEDEERAGRYDYDFRLLCEAGVNHITGWDRDKGVDQDKFDEITLDYAQKYGIGVVMPFYLRAGGDYRNKAFTDSLLEQAAAKIERFKNHPALRMWGVGNEVFYDMPQGGMRNRMAFARFYLQVADLFRKLDPDHPVIYREAEDFFIPIIRSVLTRRGEPRPWLLYGMNIYTDNLDRILTEWPTLGLPGPLIVSEFGSEGAFDGERAAGYVSMWRTIRSYPDYVLGGAPYVWTTAGPEPVDVIWGLLDRNSEPVDDTFDRLAAEWRVENGGPRSCQ
ncbi:MAG: hypothetical protein HYX92_18025 [Chloroflexi bacterium]|nr:hypothetical protein [Chloroflexota bacterium]